MRAFLSFSLSLSLTFLQVKSMRETQSLCLPCTMLDNSLNEAKLQLVAIVARGERERKPVELWSVFFTRVEYSVVLCSCSLECSVVLGFSIQTLSLSLSLSLSELPPVVGPRVRRSFLTLNVCSPSIFPYGAPSTKSVPSDWDFLLQIRSNIDTEQQLAMLQEL